MPDLTGLAALDVLIGMAFLYFLLSTVVASVNEVIQTMLNARARLLTRGIKTLLKDDAAAERFFQTWRIERLARPAGVVRRAAIKVKLPLVEKHRRPSYVPARAFALTVIESMTSGVEPKVGTNLFEEAKKTIGSIGIPAAERAAGAALTDLQREMSAVQAEIEAAFDEVMDRVSGWYKRYVGWWLLAIGAALTVALNVNSFVIAERLWKDDALRAAVVQQAEQRAGEGTTPSPPASTPQEVADEIDDIKQLGLPIGWTDRNTDGLNLLERLAGWIVTAAALTLGAPFWFDVLGKLARLRSTGNREGTSKDPDRHAEDRDDPSGRR